ncbi:MAG: hypothetical protein V2B18_06210 [Pseudomonadota bacterium]
MESLSDIGFEPGESQPIEPARPNDNLGPGPPAAAKPPAVPLFLHIPISRLVLMSIISFGVYEIYWMYRNWRYVKERTNPDIHPLLRALLGIFTSPSLLRRIHEDKEARLILMPSFSPRRLAACWITLVIISNIVSDIPGLTPCILSAFVPSFLCLAPVQDYVNSVTRTMSPGRRYYPWSWGHIVCLGFGVLIWSILLMG